MKTTTTMRPAFSMITAIFVIVIMASIGAMVVTTSGKIVKTTTAQYQREQAILYAKSYTEFAVMAVTANDRSVDCVDNIRGNTADGYSVRVHIAYIVDGNTASPGYVDTTQCSSTHVLSTSVQTAATPLTVIIDAYVDYPDPDNTAQTYTVHRRTVQKI